MRTTLTLDSDVVKLLERKSKTSYFTYKQVVNEALRAGLSVAEKARHPYVPVSFSMGGSLVNLTKANSLAAELEDQDTLAKHAKLNTTLGKKNQKR
jgi:hypothetical protein